MPDDRCRPIPLHYTDHRGLEPPSQEGASIPGMMICLGVDCSGPWWNESLVEIPALVEKAYPMLE
jgi:hypothetical protein